MPFRGAADGAPAVGVEPTDLALMGGGRADGPDALATQLSSTAELVQEWRRRQDDVRDCRAALEGAITREAISRHEVMRSLHQLTGRVDADTGGPPDRDSDDVDAVAAPRGIAISMLGSFRLTRHGQAVDNLPGSRTPRILRFLAAYRGRPVPREVLIDTFWPEADPETGRRNLHQSIYQIRCAGRVGEDRTPLIVFEHDSYTLASGAGIRCDVDEFDRHAAAGRTSEREDRTDDAIASYRSAVELYGGDYLTDVPYEDWATAERERLRGAYCTVANRLAELLIERDDVDGALDLSRRILTVDPGDEAAHRRAMRCYAASAQRGQLVRQFDVCAAALEDQCGVRPSAATVSLYRTLVASCADPDEAP